MSALARAKRRFDRGFYNALYHLYRRLFPSDAPAGRVPPSALRRVLVVRNDAIGDMVVTTPVLSYLRAAAPHAEVDVLASRRNVSLLAGDGRVDRVVVDAPSFLGRLRLVRALRARRYDAILSPILTKHFRESWFVALVAPRSAARITEWRRREFFGLFTHVVRVPGREHKRMAERLLQVAQVAIGDGPPPARAELDRYPLSLAADADAERRVDAFVRERVGTAFVAVNAWGSQTYRSMSGDYAARLAGRLAAAHADLTVVLTPPPGAEAEAARIADAAHRLLAADGWAPVAPTPPRVVVFPPPAALHDLVALLRRAALVVSPDTANVHIACAVRTPVVALYSDLTTNYQAWKPGGMPHRALVAPHREGVSAIPVDVVLTAFAELRAEVRAAPRAEPAGSTDGPAVAPRAAGARATS